MDSLFLCLRFIVLIRWYSDIVDCWMSCLQGRNRQSRWARFYCRSGVFSRRFLTKFIALLLQQWERASTPLHTFQRFTIGGVEEVMESKPYGVSVRKEHPFACSVASWLLPSIYPLSKTWWHFLRCWFSTFFFHSFCFGSSSFEPLNASCHCSSSLITDWSCWNRRKILIERSMCVLRICIWICMNAK